MGRRFYFVVKRLFDIVAAVIGILGTSPIWIIAILGIELSDPGPVFFKAVRIGKDNQIFYMWKFRSMRIPRNESEKSERSFKPDKNRIFPFGELCRRWKIDELPQLLNVLEGTMSIVGPRPVAKDQVDVMRKGKYSIAATVKPGITSPSALYDYIYGDVIEDPVKYEQLVLPTRLELEAYYPLHMEMKYDLRLIWYTIICIFANVLKVKPVGILNELLGNVEISNK